MVKCEHNVIIGKNIKKLIKENYKSQEEFAWDFHVDVKTVSRWVNGSIDSISTVQELATHFKVSFFYFFNND